MENKKKWYFISTKPGCETKVAQALKKMDVTSYVPVQKQHKDITFSKRIGHSVLFPSFVFVLMSERDHLKIRKVDNVLNIMYWLDKPVIIKSEEIRSIQQFVSTYDNVTVEKLSIDRSGKRSFQYAQSVNSSVFETEDETEKLFLFSIGYTLAATATITQLLEVA